MSARKAYQFPFSRYPAVRIALLLIGGILVYRYLSPSLVSTALALSFLLLIFTVIELGGHHSVSFFKSEFSTYLFLAIIAVFGVFRMALKAESEVSKTIKLLQVSEWEEVSLTGTIKSISTTSTGKERWNFEVNETYIGNITSADSYKARILADQVEPVATLGDHIKFTGTVIPVSDKRNPYDFDYKGYLSSQGIFVQVKIDSIHSITPNTDLTQWVWWRERALALVEHNFDSATSAIAKALLLGYKQDLDSESKTAFARAGLSHIMAVSGLHVGFIVAPFWVVIPYFWTRKHGSKIGLGILITILICYAGITGFSPSVLRASVMAAFLTFGKLFHKINDSINLTASAAIVLLVINPAQLFNIGFQLSFSAVLIILLTLPVIQSFLPYQMRVSWYSKPLMVIIVSIVVQFGLYPLQVYYFGEISLVSPVANALFVPFLGIIVPLSLAALFVTALFPSAGFILNQPSLIFLGWMNKFVTLTSEWEWAWTTATLESNLIFVLWLLLILGISAWKIAALRWKMLAGILATGCLIISMTIIQKVQPSKLTITFFDVGQGDATLLHTPNDKHILIDAGVWSPGYNSGRSVILPHLRANGIHKLDAVILSHPHADHIGGIIDLMKGVQVGKIYNSGYQYDSNLYQSYLQLAREKSIPVKSVMTGDTLALDPSMLFLVMGPDGKLHGSDPNEHSVVLNVIYGETAFLFTGDAGIEQEERLVSTYRNMLDADLLKVGHHGSRTSSGTPFLVSVSPEIAVISLGRQNRFRHPHREALARLNQTNAERLFTSLESALIFESDGSVIQRRIW